MPHGFENCSCVAAGPQSGLVTLARAFKPGSREFDMKSIALTTAEYGGFSSVANAPHTSIFFVQAPALKVRPKIK